MQPKTRYARLGRDRIAYQVLGQGPPDLVMMTGSFGHVDMAWEDPGITLFLRTLASFARLIQFDRRGNGASDPLPLDSLPPWESGPAVSRPRGMSQQRLESAGESRGSCGDRPPGPA
jgi:pimeloyl-ACP methyl ester carboxylesterase